MPSVVVDVPLTVRPAERVAGRRSRGPFDAYSLRLSAPGYDGRVKPGRQLPQLEDGLFLTDGGLETVLIFQRGLELPEFAAFPLLEDQAGTATLRDYYRPYLALARERGAGFVLESPTWRANPDWAQRLGYGPDELARANRRAIGLMQELREEFTTDVAPIVISGCIGPQSDGYSPTTHLEPEPAREYHAVQIATFAETEADMVTVMTMTYADEAVGVALAARDSGMPAVISFTVETDGRLPSGQPLGEAIEQVDAQTGGSPAYYMVNCAHPPTSRTCSTAPGASASAPCEPTPPRRATPSSTRPRSSTRATRRTWPPAMPRCASGCRGCGCSAAAAAQIIATWRRSAGRGRTERLVRLLRRWPRCAPGWTC